MSTGTMGCRMHSWFGLVLFVLAVSASQKANAQLAGLFRSVPGTLATYEYQGNGFQSVMLPADITISFSGDVPNSTMSATIHRPIIGDTAEGFDYPIVGEFPMVVTGTSSDGHRFHGDLLGTQYLFDWDIEPAANGELLWNGRVYWAGGRYELSTVTDARLIAVLPGDFNQDGTVDAADYVVWRKNDGTQAGFDTWRAHFGQTSGGGNWSDATVPEPGTDLLLLVGAVLGGWKRRRFDSRIPSTH